MKKLLKDPLFHFLLIGAALFIISGLIKGPAENQQTRIIINQGDIDALQANFVRTWQRSPTENELSGLIEEKVRDEMAYREAVAMGLDTDDAVIRKRLRMKMELLVEDGAGLSSPSDEKLAAHLGENRDLFRQEAQVSFKHVYLNSDKRGAAVEGDARQMLVKLAAAGPGAAPESFSDPNMLPQEFPLYYVSDIERLFGASFGKDILQIEPGNWQGPVRSSYGLHLVFVHQRIEESDPELIEVHDAVKKDWIAKQRSKLKEETYKKLRERYTITIEKPAASGNENKISTKAQ